MKQGGSRNAVFRRKLLAASVAACFAVSASQLSAQVLPTGATGVVGVTGINQAGSTLTVNTTGNSVLNYTSFSIGAGATVQINQASAASASLQRVIGAGGVIPQSVIDGMLKSNGRVFLLNPSGVVIGAGARIDVAGFVASSLNMSDEDFLKGRMRFTENAAAKAVKNYGEITTTKGGHVYLVAPEVENHGIIRAPGGQILLAAGKSAELISDASPYVTVKVVADVQKALNVGDLIADSGKIGIYGALVQHSGVAEASGAVVGPGGEIRFVATKDLTIDAGSRIAANGTSGGKVVLQAEGGTNLIAGTVEAKGSTGKGGEVQALGVRVGVIGHGIIDASGETGGGKVLVGGDFQGKNAAIQNAERTFIGPDGVIRADAGANGDGGRVIVWADGDTRFYGHISAQGGSQSGNGGFVETSGKGSLQAFGRVNVSAAKGSNGTWLLDPEDLEVVEGTYGSASGDSLVYSDGQIIFGEIGPYGSQVSSGAIEGVVGNVLLQANNNITFSTGIDKDNGGLEVNAGYDIHLGGNVIKVAGPLTMTTYYGSITGATQPGVTQLVSTGGDVDLDAGTMMGQYRFGVSVDVGGIDTTNPAGASGSVTIHAGSIATGNITTRALNAGYGGGGDVTLIAHSGRVVVNGSIEASGADGNPIQYAGTDGGNVTLESSYATGAEPAVLVTGLIRSTGGSGVTNVDGFSGGGGSGGQVTAFAEYEQNPYGFTGSVAISIGGIQNGGGAGANNGYGGAGFRDAGSGGNGGNVLITVEAPEFFYGSVTVGQIAVGSIESAGGSGGNRFGGSGNGGNGGSAGQVTLEAPSVGVTSVIDARGGNGGSSEQSFGGNGGSGGSVNAFGFYGGLVVSASASGGAGGSGVAGYGGLPGGDGGGGGSINLGGVTATVAYAAAVGGRGGDGAEGGSGGSGGSVTVFGQSFLLANYVDVSGGSAGNSSGSSNSAVGVAGSAGSFDLGSDGTTQLVFVAARGGNGTNWSGNGGVATPGGFGGDGGEGYIYAGGNLILGNNPLTGKSTVVVDVSGGTGGTGGAGASPGGDGGSGGSAGSLDLQAPTMLINGVLAAAGGDGGAGGPGAGGAANGAAGAGGAGGSIGFSTGDGTGIITFANGGWDVSGGTGSIAGSAGNLFGQGVYPQQLIATPRFVHTGPGDLDDISVQSVGVFRFTALSDPLAIPEVLQQVGLTQTDPMAGKGESSEEEETEKEKTGSLGSCRPS
jgi:filamentous hemagglutinin family protein